MSFVRRAARWYPFTAFGSLTLLGAIVLWPLSLRENSRAGLFLSAFAFVLLAGAALSTYLSATAARSEDFSWTRATALRVGENDSALRVTCRAKKLPSFLCVHLRLSGALLSAGAPLFHLVLDRRLPDAGEAMLGLSLPAGGELSLHGHFSVRDILGLSIREIGAEAVLRCPVRVLPWGKTTASPIDDNAHENPQSLRKIAEQEKIFVREYVPGDLARDINWKALARIGTLLTRVPPEAPKESKIVRIVVSSPPLGRTRASRATSFVQLDHIRALTASLLEEIRRTAPDYGFCVLIAGHELSVGAEEPFDTVYDDLARMGFESRAAVPSSGYPEKTWLVGSAFDPELRAWLGAGVAQGSRFILSRLETRARTRSASRAEKDEWFRFRFFACFPDSFPLPRLVAFFLPTRRRRPETESVFSDGVAIPYAERLAETAAVFEYSCGVTL